MYNGENRTFFYFAYENYRDRNLIYSAPNRSVPIPEFYHGDFGRLLGARSGRPTRWAGPCCAARSTIPHLYQLDNGRWAGDVFPDNRIPVAILRRVQSADRDGAKRLSSDGNQRQRAGRAPEQFLRSFKRIPITDDRFVSVKLDQIISNNHKLSGVWTIDDQGRTLDNNGGIFDASAGVLGGPLERSPSKRYAARTHGFHTTGRSLHGS